MKRILIIDDDDDICSLFKLFLEYNGYKIDVFTDPIDVLYSFKTGMYDLVLLDLQMPKIDGIILYNRLKTIDSTLLVLFITADFERVQVLKKNIPDIETIIMYKPILLSELLKKIHSIFLLKKNLHYVI